MIVNALDLDTLTLKAGAHKPDTGEMSLMEAVAYVAGEPWSESPVCASPVIAVFLRSWSDDLGDEVRNRLLKPYVYRLVGTAASQAVEDARAWMCLDWLVRSYTPVWLRLAGLVDDAILLEGLPEFRDGVDLWLVRTTTEAARRKAAAVRIFARIVRSATGDAARTIRDATLATACAAGGDGARSGAWTSDKGVAEAAWDASLYAIRSADLDALQPAVAKLQLSAMCLLNRMIECLSSI